MPAKIDRIRNALGTLGPAYMELSDESHMHSRGLETHYRAVIVSDAFAGVRAIKRHQQVYRALGALMDEVHALALHTYTPDEWASTGQAPDSPRCRGGGKSQTQAA